MRYKTIYTWETCCCPVLAIKYGNYPNSSLKLKSSGNTCSQFEADQACKFLIQDVTEHLTKCARAPSAGLLAQDWQNQHLG